MPTPTYTLLDSVTLASSAASVTFSSISAAGKGDLVLVTNAKNTDPENSYLTLNFNGDAGTNYPLVNMIGYGSSTESRAPASGPFLYVNLDSRFTNSDTRRGLSQIAILDFSATDKHKSILIRNDVAETGTEAIAARWANTSAISTILISMSNAGSFAIGSTFNLFQIVSE
jgi:hypothetical protein